MKLLIAALLLTLAGCSPLDQQDVDYPLTCATEYGKITFYSGGGYWRKGNNGVWYDSRSRAEYSSTIPEQCSTVRTSLPKDTAYDSR